MSHTYAAKISPKHGDWVVPSADGKTEFPFFLESSARNAADLLNKGEMTESDLYGEPV